MSTIVEYYKQAELALASYATLSAGTLDSASINALRVAKYSSLAPLECYIKENSGSDTELRMAA